MSYYIGPTRSATHPAIETNDDRKEMYMRWNRTVAAATLALAAVAGFGAGEAKAQATDIAVIENFASGQWRFIPKPPFPASGIAGDNKNGLIVFGGDDNRTVAVIQNYNAGRWDILPPA